VCPLDLSALAHRHAWPIVEAAARSLADKPVVKRHRPHYASTAMCGICGVIQIGDEPRIPVEPHVLDRMTDAMRHRGPNDRGTHVAPGIALGVRRLSIVDVEGGHQPFANEDESVWAVQNGELYNHDAIRAELRAAGHRFRSRCDTEILPHLYEREGDRVPERLRGKFAIAVWDGNRRRAVLARDRMGVKPLYYAQAGDLLVFASELKSVLASGLVSTDLDLESIDAYLTLGFFAGPSTPLAAVRKLLPGHRLVVDAGEMRLDSYWELPYPQTRQSGDGRELAERLLEVLETSVRLRLMSDVPLGAMLSGGLDSSVVTALMARNSTRPVKTFSVGFVEDSAGNELADARLVASSLGTEHHELELSLGEQAVALEELAWHLDEPLADLSALGFHALSRLAAKEVTVALSGQGADELLGGYSAHRNAALAARWQRVPRSIRRPAESLSLLLPSRFERLARVLAEEDPVERFLLQTSKVSAAEHAALLGREIPELEAAAAVVRERLGGERGNPLDATLYLDQQLGLVDDMLHYFDRTSMAHSLEVRVPFLDHELVELCATFPTRAKVDWRLTGKAVLRRAARGLVPDRVIEKPKVGFFNQAVSSWFRAQADAVVSDRLLRGDAATADLLDRQAVEQLVHAFRTDPARAPVGLLLAVLMLEIWLSDTLPRAAGADRGRQAAVPA
jgi:asparagine synthase (glutamine-hydrolysing)